MMRSRLTLRSALVLTAGLIGIVSCGEDATAPRRALATVNVSLANVTLEVGQLTGAIAAAFDQDGAPIATGPVIWSSDTPSIAGISPTTGLILAISPGTTRIVATIDGVTGERAVTVVNAPAIRINEVQSRGDAPGGWIEFFNPTDAVVDMSEWTLIDNNFFGPAFTFPAGNVIPARGYLVIEEAALPFGLDAADSALLFSRYGVLVNPTFWSTQPATTYGRCPDGTGTFISTTGPTKGTVNACPAT